MIKQKFIPGEEWLYLKIYLPATKADELVASLHKTMTPLERQGLIDRWFFIRYTDPQFHIRLRVHLGDPENNIGAVIFAVKNMILKHPVAGTVDKVMLDTYVRELDRYGGNNIVACEAFFHEDSKHISRLLGCGHTEETLWQCALSFVVHILDICKSTDNDRLEFVTGISRQMMSSTGLDNEDARTLNAKFRENRKAINLWLDEKACGKKFAFNSEMTELSRKIAKKYPECIPSLIHMHCNRLFRMNQRICEAIVYYFLTKYYRGRIALGKMG